MAFDGKIKKVCFLFFVFLFVFSLRFFFLFFFLFASFLFLLVNRLLSKISFFLFLTDEKKKERKAWEINGNKKSSLFIFLLFLSPLEWVLVSEKKLMFSFVLSKCWIFVPNSFSGSFSFILFFHFSVFLNSFFALPVLTSSFWFSFCLFSCFSFSCFFSSLIVLFVFSSFLYSS